MVSYKKMYENSLKQIERLKERREIETGRIIANKVLAEKNELLKYRLPIFFSYHGKPYSISKTYPIIAKIVEMNPQNSTIGEIIQDLKERKIDRKEIVIEDEKELSFLNFDNEKNELEGKEIYKIDYILTNNHWFIYELRYEVDSTLKDIKCQHLNLRSEFTQECVQEFTFNKDNILIKKEVTPEIFDENVTDFYCRDCGKKFPNAFAQRFEHKFTHLEVLDTPIKKLENFEEFLENRGD